MTGVVSPFGKASLRGLLGLGAPLSPIIAPESAKGV